MISEVGKIFITYDSEFLNWLANPIQIKLGIIYLSYNFVDFDMPLKLFLYTERTMIPMIQLVNIQLTLPAINKIWDKIIYFDMN